jgi:hypothetical protein
MATIKFERPHSESEKHTRTTVDTKELTPKVVTSWKLPPFQRELKINSKVQAVVQQIKSDRGVLPGILTLGVLDHDIYIVDGQHRIQAFLLSDEAYGYADVRTVFFENMAEMAEEYERLNSQLVQMRPDDKLRALEHSSEAIRKIRKKCPFIGYDNIRRDSKNSPVLSMSTFLRAWTGSRGETPTMGVPAKEAVKSMDERDTDNAIEFASLAFSAWSRDREYFRLWGGANLSICMWIFRRMVLSESTSGTSRWTKLNKDQFRKGLLSLSAEPAYLDYLVGRNVGDRDRTPIYARVKTIMTKRMHDEIEGRIMFPQPPWVHA